MSAAVGTKELNFQDRRERAISASASRVEVPCSNGNSFDPGQTIDIRLPSGMARGNYLNFVDSYVKMSLSVTKSENDDKLFLPRNGVYNLIQKVEILTSSSTISVIDDYHKLCNIFLDSECSQEFKNGLGGVQYGMTSGIDPQNTFTGTLSNTDITGTLTSGVVANNAVEDTAITGTVTSNAMTITNDPTKSSKGLELTSATAGTKKTTLCFGLILTPLFSNSKYLPLFSSDNITIRLTLASLAEGFMQDGATGDMEVSYNPVSMICNIIKLDPEAQMMVDQSNGGVYTMILDDFRNSKASIAIPDRQTNVNLGMSFQSLSRVIFAYSPDGLAGDADTQGARSSRKVIDYAFQLNGQNYPAQRIKAKFGDSDENVSEAIAEIRASTRQSGDFSQSNDISLVDYKQENPNGKETQGKAFYELDLEGLRATSENSVYSGLYTVGGTTSLSVAYDADGTTANTVNVWGQYQGALTLDTNQSNIYTYSV